MNYVSATRVPEIDAYGNTARQRPRSTGMRTPRILLWPSLAAAALVDASWWIATAPFRAAWYLILYTASIDLHERALPPGETTLGYNDDDLGEDVDR
jgi:hypothetical protein